MKIVASGTKNGKKLTVEARTVADSDIWRYKFNGEDDYDLESELYTTIEERHPIGGTYYPIMGSGLSVVSALNWFFDTQPEISTDDMNEEIPQEGDGVY